MPMTPEELKQALAEITSELEKLIVANLNDPDLASQTAEYKAGYARGFREASIGFISKGLKDRLMRAQ